MAMRGKGRIVALAGWTLCFSLGAWFLGMFGWGVLRDSHFEEARLELDLGRASDPAAAPFRIWGSGAHDIHLTTVNSRSRPTDPVRDPTTTPLFGGAVEVRVFDPEGEVRLHEVLRSETLEHALPDNVEWTRLGTLQLRGLPFRTWRLEAGVVSGDATFAAGDGYRSNVLIRKRRGDPGMGGLINYVMFIPGAVFAGLSLLLGVQLARTGGSRAPAALSVGLFVVLGVLWM